MKKYRDSLKKRGLCVSCQRPSDSYVYCLPCREKRNKNDLERLNKRRKSSLCIQCGTKTLDTIRCQKCLGKFNDQRNERHRINKDNGVCVLCGRYTEKTKWCETCKVAQKKSADKRHIKLAKNKICVSCGKNKHLTTLNNVKIYRRFCQTCYLKYKSNSCFNSTKYWENLLNLLEKQNWLCPFSGEKIVLGLNDGLDHIDSRSLFPNKSKDINNIQWTTRVVNRMKHKYTTDKFLQYIKMIYDYSIRV